MDLAGSGTGVLNSMKLLRLDGALPIDGRLQMDRAGWALDVGLGWADGSGGWALDARLDGDGMGTGSFWMGLDADLMVMGRTSGSG